MAFTDGASSPIAPELSVDSEEANLAAAQHKVQQDEAVYNYGTLRPRNPDREGLSVFHKDENGAVFHTYSAYARGIDMVNTAYHYLDLVPKGRDEEGGRTQFWVRRRDEY